MMNKIKTKKIRPEEGYWIIPPEIHNPLNDEFKFEFDPCPNPKPKEFDGLVVDWKKSNWVNPPFWAGITAWVRKALAEQEKGNTSVLILPLDNWVRLLIEAGAEIRSVGSHEWIHTKDGTRRKAPRPSFLFILKPKNICNKIKYFIPETICRFIIVCFLIYLVNNSILPDFIKTIIDLIIIFWVVIPIQEEKNR